MKKFLVMLVVSCLMMFSSVCLAANDSKDLNKQQQIAERMLDSFDGEPAPLYAQVAGGFAEQMKASVTEEAYNELCKQVRIKFGTMKEAKFFAFQRFDQGDRVSYIANFSKEKLVSMIFVFNKENKLVDFAFTPVQQPQAAPQQQAAQ